MRNPLQSGVFCAKIQRYTQKTRKGDFRKGAEQVFWKEEALRKKKTKNGGLKHERNFNETVTGSRCSFRTSDKKMEP